MSYIEIQRGKEEMNIYKFQQYIGGNAVFMKRLMRSTKVCDKLTSNDNYFADIWFSGVVIDDKGINEGLYYYRKVKVIHKVSLLDIFKRLMMDCPGGSYLVMK